MQNVRTGSLEHAKSLTGEANFPHHMEVPTDPNDDGLTLRMAQPCNRVLLVLNFTSLDTTN